MKRFTTDALNLFALFGFAVAQPLFDLLGRYGEFFVAHGSDLTDIVLLALIPSVALPMGFILAEWVLEKSVPRLRVGAHLVLVGLLFGFFLLAPLDSVSTLKGLPALLLAAAAVPIAAWGYARAEWVRSFTSLLAVASLTFPVLFVLDSDVQRAVARAPRGEGPIIEAERDNRVVMMIFDEFPLASLLDRNLEIDPVAFPHFAALAERAYWFRGATTVSPGTTISVPAILDGRLPKPGALPTRAEHPNTLFEVLASTHRIRAYETVTQLWSEEDEGAVAPNFGFRTLLVDSVVAGLHVWTPTSLKGRLPPINLNWGDFAGGGDEDETHAIEIRRDRSALMRDFIRGIRRDERPTFHFLHILLPHFPWEFLPSGHRYGSVSTFSGSGTGIAGVCPEVDQWCADQDVVDQNYERHLLQVGFVDRLVGELIDRLESEGIFDETLLVITADHGVSFRAGGMRRASKPDNLSEILPIPLFIKAPDQQAGATLDQIVETIDVFPAVAELLDIDLPWSPDGRSPIAPASPARVERRYYPSAERAEAVPFSSPTGDVAEAVARKFSVFPAGPPYRLADRHTAWVGKRTEAIPLAGASGLRVEIENRSHFDQVDLTGNFIPVFLSGRIEGEIDSTRTDLAIAVSGVLCAGASPYRAHSGDLVFFSVIPESCLRPGRNTIDVFAIDDRATGPRLFSVESDASPEFRIVETGAGIALEGPGRRRIAVRTDQPGGRIDSSHAIGDKVEFSGWAADLVDPVLPDRIVVFVDGKSVFAAPPSSDRPGTARAASSDRVLKSGFLFSFPRSLIATANVRLFALFPSGDARELGYHKNYAWRSSSESRR